MTRLLAFGWLTLGLCALLAAVAGAQMDPPAEREADVHSNERLIAMDFQDVDLSVLVKFMSEMTAKNFILDDKVQGKITIISPGKMSVEEAYAAFQSALQVKGFTTVPSGAVIKIVPTKAAKTSSIRTVMPKD